MTAQPLPQARRGRKASLLRTLGKLLAAAVMVAGLAAALLVLAGVFRAKVPQETHSVPPQTAEHLEVAEVRLVRRPRFESAVGTVRAVHEAAVASKLLAKVVEVRVRAGQPVSQDEILIRLDDADLQSRLEQAEAALRAAQAVRERAEADHERARRLVANRTISQAEFDQVAAAWRAAMAEAERASQAVQEARVVLEYATIRAPISGVVIDKRVEVGDTVTPGQVLLTLYDPARMQMVVSVRESLAQRLQVGQKVRGRLDALGHDCEATVSEIVPEAQAASRSFTVKVTGPCPPGVYSGMFGRIDIPLEEEELLVVPAAAVTRVGQLEMVDVVAEGTIERRSVQLGRRLEDHYEVLAGLAAGERVVLQRPRKKGRG
ncbi:MAG: efflux RND transporter periplasmic adaptor subunit [Pirellulales bacterium]|nr:efflux RND transporter periplasmic adaptor subunit [Pirellulales bacterium]